MKRRQFLILSGALGGGSLAVLAHKALTPATATSGQIAPTAPIESFALSQRPAATQPTTSVAKAIAPKGLFAPPRGDVRIVVISDFNSQYGSTQYDPEVDRAIALIPDWQPDLVLAGGDMVAGQSRSLTREQIQAMWAAFDRHVSAPLRKAGLPFGFTVGNHDASGALSASGNFLFQQERELAAAHWNQARHNPGLKFVDRAKFPFYYSFQQQGIFYLVWDASTASLSAEQLAWVEKSLASQVAQSAKLRIVIGHLPLYAVAVGRDRPGEILNNADQLRSLLERYRVHTYISGHHHAYFPGHRGRLQLLHAGALGSGPRRLINSDLPPQKTLTVVDVKVQNAADTTYTTYDLQTLQVVDHRKLPKVIVGPNGMVLRRDINCQDLPTGERAVCLSS